jgi:sensor histidine kinase regulating citrate/malate metabolism
LPVSTKGDPSNHGFGLKSIRYTAQKYGGSITTGIEDDWFVLKMLIPLKDSGS